MWDIIEAAQWQIQDFPEGGTNSKRVCANLLFCNFFFAENCMKWKNLDPEGGTCPWHPSWIRQWGISMNITEQLITACNEVVVR